MAMATYSSASEFLSRYDPQQPGCAVFDVRMPGMSGLELQDELNRRGAIIPVIFITGHGDVPMAVEAMQNGAFDFLQKPIRDKDLSDCIQRALSRNRDDRAHLQEKDDHARLSGADAPGTAGLEAGDGWQTQQDHGCGPGRKPAYGGNPSRPSDGEDGRYLAGAPGANADAGWGLARDVPRFRSRLAALLAIPADLSPPACGLRIRSIPNWETGRPLGCCQVGIAFHFNGRLAMNIVRREPFRDVESIFREFAMPAFGRLPRLFDDSGAAFEWSPSADISETDKEYIVKAELPGVQREDVKVSIADGVLTIKGERKQEKEEKGEHTHRLERIYGSFCRSFSLPEDADDKHVRAETKDGVLRVYIPKTKTGKSAPVQVKVE
jgi:HSP20 family protein